MPDYDGEHYSPPAPVAHVQLRNPHTRKSCADVPMLLDSGADVTLIPRAAVDFLQLESQPGRSYELLGFDGSISFAPVVNIELLVCGKLFRGQFLVIDQDRGILGRNVLNAIRLCFDGPALSWREV